MQGKNYSKKFRLRKKSARRETIALVPRNFGDFCFSFRCFSCVIVDIASNSGLRAEVRAIQARVYNIALPLT